MSAFKRPVGGVTRPNNQFLVSREGGGAAVGHPRVPVSTWPRRGRAEGVRVAARPKAPTKKKALSLNPPPSESHHRHHSGSSAALRRSCDPVLGAWAWSGGVGPARAASTSYRRGCRRCQTPGFAHRRVVICRRPRPQAGPTGCLRSPAVRGWCAANRGRTTRRAARVEAALPARETTWRSPADGASKTVSGRAEERKDAEKHARARARPVDRSISRSVGRSIARSIDQSVDPFKVSIGPRRSALSLPKSGRDDGGPSLVGRTHACG
jgi:hypothetical protein